MLSIVTSGKPFAVEPPAGNLIAENSSAPFTLDYARSSSYVEKVLAVVTIRNDAIGVVGLRCNHASPAIRTDATKLKQILPNTGKFLQFLFQYSLHF